MSDHTYTTNEARIVFIAGAAWGAFTAVAWSRAIADYRRTMALRDASEQLRRGVDETRRRSDALLASLRKSNGGSSAVTPDEAAEMLGVIKFQA